MFCYENKLTFPIYVSDQKFENSTDLLLVTNENKSHYFENIITSIHFNNKKDNQKLKHGGK